MNLSNLMYSTESTVIWQSVERSTAKCPVEEDQLENQLLGGYVQDPKLVKCGHKRDIDSDIERGLRTWCDPSIGGVNRISLAGAVMQLTE
jgi:hypothetical protein